MTNRNDQTTTVLQGNQIPTEMPPTEDVPPSLLNFRHPAPLFDPTAGQYQVPIFRDAEEAHAWEQEIEAEKERQRAEARESLFGDQADEDGPGFISTAANAALSALGVSEGTREAVSDGIARLSDAAPGPLKDVIKEGTVDLPGIGSARKAIFGGIQQAGELAEGTFAEDAVDAAQDVVVALDRAASLEHTLSWAERQMALSGWTNDPEFHLSRLSSEQKSFLYDGLEADEVDALGKNLEGAVSWEHAQAIRDQYNEVVNLNEDLRAHGNLGVGARVLTAIADPVALGLSAFTGSLNIVSKGSRLSKAVYAGGLSAAEVAALESYMMQTDPFRTPESVMFSAVAGFGLGAGASYLLDSARVGFQDQVLGREAEAEGIVPPGTAPEAQRDIDLGETDVSQQADPNRPYATETKVNQRDFSSGYDFRINADEIVAEEQVRAGNAAPISPVNRTVSLDDADSLMERARNERPPKDAAKWEPNIRGRLFSSDNDLVAWTAERLFPTLHGRGGRGPAPVNAMDRSTRLFRSAQLKVNKTYLNAYKDWQEEVGATQTNILTRRQRFNREVYRTVRDPNYSSSPSIQRVANEIKETHRQLVERADRAGMRGAARFRIDKLLEDMPSATGYRIADAELAKAGTDGLVRGAVVAGSPELPADLASQLAEAYSILSRARAEGSPIGIASPDDVFDLDPTMALAEARVLAKPGQFQVDLQALREGLQEFRKNNPEATIGLDRNYSVTNEATGVSVKMESLLDENIEALVENSNRRVTGYIGMAEAGFKDPIEDFDNLLEVIRLKGGEYPTSKTVGIPKAGLGKTVPVDLDGDIDRLRFIRDMMIGGSTVNAGPRMSPAMNDLLRQWRQYQFTRVMGMSGFSQLADIGTGMGAVGIRNFMQHIPAFRSILKRARTGDIDDDLADELEAALAPGVDKILDQPTSRFTDGVTDMERATNADRVLGHMNRATAEISGMYLVQGFAERITARAAAQRLAKQALGVKGQRPLSKRRLESMGLSGEWVTRVFDQLKKHSKFQEDTGLLTGRRLSSLDLENWDDIAARERFIDALHQFTRKAVQRNDPQDLAMWMHSDIGKTVTQFQSFMYAAWSKQLLHGLRMHDIETFTMFSLSTLTGGLGHTLRYYALSGKSDDPEEYRREHLSPEAIGAGAFYRSSWASFLPQIMDAGGQMVGADPVWTYGRMPSDIANMPSMDMVDKTWSFVSRGSSSVFDPDADMTERDWENFTALLPLQNALGINHALSILTRQAGQ